MTPERIAQLYEVFKDHMPWDLRELGNEVVHWKAIWEMVNVAETHSAIHEINPDLYPSMGLCCHGDLCVVDSHGISHLQRIEYQELSALYNDN